MSIIQEALKKVEKVGKVGNTKSYLTIEAAPKKPKRLFAFLFIIIFLGAAGYAVKSYLNEPWGSFSVRWAHPFALLKASGPETRPVPRSPERSEGSEVEGRAEGSRPKSESAPAPIAPRAEAEPLEKLVEVKGEPPSLILNGIMYLENSPRAIINGIVVEEGEVLSGATVLKINKNNVLLNYQNTTMKLDLRN